MNTSSSYRKPKMYLSVAVTFICLTSWPTKADPTLPTCGPSGNGKLRYMWGDAFHDQPCLGPNGLRYPTHAINTIVQSYSRSLRRGRSMEDPFHVRDRLLSSWASANGHEESAARIGREPRITANNQSSCNSSSPKRLCRTTYNTTAPMYGVSLTSGEPVTIVQKFPDLLQQVIFETCVSDECDIIRGKCTQTYVPYLFLVVPLGPVTLTGQDYIMVESGCVCRTQPATET